MFSSLIIFSIIQEWSIQILFHSILRVKICNIFHLLSKSCKINPNFNLILSNEITVGANRKFFTLTRNGLKAIATKNVKRIPVTNFLFLIEPVAVGGHQIRVFRWHILNWWHLEWSKMTGVNYKLHGIELSSFLLALRILILISLITTSY